MKKYLTALIGIVGISIGLFLLLREFAGWNDGMDQPRSEIHAATLAGEIYVAGGIGLFRVLDSCEKYTPARNSWSRCAPLPRPLHHIAMAADDHRIYASGGYSALPFKPDMDGAIFAYDPKTDQWSILAKLPYPIGQHAMIHRGGTLFLIGGQSKSKDLDNFWAYHIAEDKWTAMPSMPTARHSHAIATSPDRLFVTGGRSAALGTEIDRVEVFDFTSGKWQRLADMPIGRAGHGAAFYANRLHIWGGESLRHGTLLPSHDILDLTSSRWTVGPPMDLPRHGFAVASADDLAQNFSIGGGAHAGMKTIYSVTGTLQSPSLSQSERSE